MKYVPLLSQKTWLHRLLRGAIDNLSRYEFAEHCVATGPALQVLISTGHDDVQIYLRATRARAVAYVPQPIDEQDLLRAIKRALGQKA
jgi:FixJ family two-component response regulator